MNDYLKQYPLIEGHEAFTPARLREIADAWDQVYHGTHPLISELGPIATGLAYHRAEQARGIANWMIAKGVASRRNIGPFQLDFFQKGDVVRIKKGTVVRRMNSDKPIKAGKDYVVTVHRASTGYTDNLHKPGKAVVTMPEVVWAGTGGYWTHAAADDVELVSRSDVAA